MGKEFTSESKKADIVLIIDKSLSMGDKIQQVQNAANNFSENILNNSNGNVRIAVGSFDYNIRNSQIPGRSSYINTDFTTEIDIIKEKIYQINVGGGTNTQDGIWRAGDLLKGARLEANKYVVFFTDGLPTQSHRGGDGSKFLDSFFKDAQKEYYRNFVGYGQPVKVEIGGIGYEYSNENKIGKSEIITVNNTPKYKDVKFYSVGLFTNEELDRESRINFLKTIQNAVENSKYEENYYTEKLIDIDGIFMDISNDINQDLNTIIYRDVVFRDVINKEFNIIRDSVKVVDLLGNEIKLLNQSIVIREMDDGCEEITIKVPDIIANKTNENGEKIGGVKITFDITVKDQYFSGEGIKTNMVADVSYIITNTGVEHKDKFKQEPQINISRKEAQIKVVKNIKDEEGNIISDITPFEIVIQRKPRAGDPTNIVDYNKSYILKSTESNESGIKHLIGSSTVSSDGEKILSTQIENKDDYLIEGEYVVKEVNIPVNYDISEIIVNGISNKNSSNKNEGTFILSKDNPNISIEVINFSTAKVEVEKTVQKIEDRIYEVNLVIKSNGITLNEGLVEDIVADEFEVVEDNFYSGKVSSITNLLTGEEIILSEDGLIISDNTLKWNIGDIPKEGISIRFRVKVKNDYFGGYDIKTNREAYFKYINYKGEEIKLFFPKPSVDIPYIIGKINIIKEIVEKDKNGKWVKINDKDINTNDKFSISVVGEEKFTVDLIGNSEAEMIYYLKDNDTKITNNLNMYPNYITIGTFEIKELLPMNYEMVEILIRSNTSDSNDTWVKLEEYLTNFENIKSGKVRDGKIVIDNNTPNLNIKIRNVLINKNYWKDKELESNILEYDKRQIGFIENIKTWITEIFI